jgi:zinc protease
MPTFECQATPLRRSLLRMIMVPQIMPMAKKINFELLLRQRILARHLRRILSLVLLAGSVCVPVAAQKLPSADRVVDNYLKAIGGKKRVARIRDATYEWSVQLNEQPIGAAKMQIKAPSSARIEMTLGDGRLILGVNTRSAWMQGMDGKHQALTGAEGAAAKLQAALDASHLLDLKKRSVLARVMSIRQMDAKESAYVVEFSLRSGARLKYLFSTTSKLLLKIEDDELRSTTRFSDFRSAGDILEPHHVRLNNATGDLMFTLQRAKYNTGVPDSVFDSPGADQ